MCGHTRPHAAMYGHACVSKKTHAQKGQYSILSISDKHFYLYDYLRTILTKIRKQQQHSNLLR